MRSWLQPVHAGLEGGLLALLPDDGLHLLLGLVHHLFDAAGVDAAVQDELVQGHPGDLAPHRVEGGEDHGLRRVVDDQVDAGGLLQGADVAALAADDAALHLVVGQRHHGDRALGHLVGGVALDGRGDDVAGAPVGLGLGLGLDLADAARRVLLHLGLDLLQQEFLGLRLGEGRDPLQLLRLLLLQGLDVRPKLLDLLLLRADGALAPFDALHLVVQVLFALLQAALLALQLGAALAVLGLHGGPLAQGLVFGLQQHLALLGLGLFKRLFGADLGGLSSASRPGTASAR